MADPREINKAVANHSYWKARLHDAIDTGRSDYNPANVGVDNQCDFGKWFYSLPEEDKNSAVWNKVRLLHARFHAAAANILQLALAGRKDEALALISDLKGEYITVSVELTNTMLAWKNSLS
jgi:hypothetical protein